MRLVHLLLLILSGAALTITVMSAFQHDYLYYLEQWNLVLTHQNPWSTNSAYGPLHNAFALLVPISPFAPKLLTAGLFIVANYAIVQAISAAQPSGGWGMPYLAAIGLNALVITSIFIYGLNDGFVAALLIFAVLARRNGNVILAGALIGLAALDKYYPALLLPFFALDRRVWSPRLLLSGFGTIALGMGIAIIIWGNDYLEAITYGVSRDATIWSILKPLAVLSRGYGDPANIVALLIRFNGPMVLAVFAIALIAAWARRDSWLVSATWAFFAILLTYKVGNPQYWVSWLALVACLPLLHDPAADRLARAAIPFALFATIYELGYALLTPIYYLGPLSPVNDYVGLVCFGLGVATLVYFFREPKEIA